MNTLSENFINLLKEKKAQNIELLILDEKYSSITNYFIVASVYSKSHINAIFKEILKLKNNILIDFDFKYGDWLAVDTGDFILHLFINNSEVYKNNIEIFYKKSNKITKIENLF